jgi:hypothetical protein
VTPLAVGEYAPLRDDEYALADGALRTRDGRSIPVVDKRLEGAVDRSARTDLGLELGGWARTADGSPVDLLLAFAGDRLEAVGIPTRDRPGLNPGGSVEDLGFALALDPDAVAADAPVRVLAVAGGVASPLAFYCGADAQQAIGCP